MKRKIFMGFVALMMAGTAAAQTVAANKDELVDELFALGEEGADEIDNYDFLYSNDGGSMNYDELMTENILQEAVSHIGKRYVYGSKGPKTFDCSGFTSYVYKHQNNVWIGASSREQYAINTPIKRSEMQAGDLVFFTSPRSGRNVGHVGIILSYDPGTDTFTFIHASTKEGIKISKSTEGYYQRRYIGVRRVKE
ncbi:MAG: C40 family peptidase [Prevotella sp.]|nr:C40 family peptidase [Prevotella sp.]